MGFKSVKASLIKFSHSTLQLTFNNLFPPSFGIISKKNIPNYLKWLLKKPPNPIRSK